MVFDKFIELHESELINKLGITRQTIWMWKKKKSIPKRSLLERIKKEFELQSLIIVI